MNRKYINGNKGKSRIAKKYFRDKKTVIYEDIPERKEVYCSFCGFNTLIKMDQLSLYCNHCHNISLIEDLQEVQHLEEPRTLDNKEWAISTTPLPGYGDVAIKKPPNYHGSFKALSLKGIKIKDYKVTDGSGKPIYEGDE